MTSPDGSKTFGWANSSERRTVPEGSIGTLLIIAVSWGILDRMVWLLDEFSQDLLALVAIHTMVDPSSVVPPTPYGLYGSYLLPVLTTVGTITVLVAWFGCVSQFAAMAQNRRPDWRRSLAVAVGRMWTAVGYAVLTAGVVGLGLVAFAIPGVYAAGRLLPGALDVLHGASAVETIRTRLITPSEATLRVGVWFAVFAVLGGLTTVLLGLPSGIVVAGVGWAKTAADASRREEGQA